MLTQAELKKQLNYDSLTGIFTRKTTNSPNVKIGDIAGSVHHSGYLYLTINSKSYACHRLAFLYMNGNFPENYVDHINLNKSDNRWLNLREANAAQNIQHRPKQENNKSGYKGVSFDGESGKWKAQININKCRKNLGRFNTKIEAYEEYIKYAKLIHKEFFHA